jgi:hypothetical protein
MMWVVFWAAFIFGGACLFAGATFTLVLLITSDLIDALAATVIIAFLWMAFALWLSPAEIAWHE